MYMYIYIYIYMYIYIYSGIVGSMVDIDDSHSVRASVKQYQQCHRDLVDIASDADGMSHIAQSMQSMKMDRISSGGGGGREMEA
jgi:hypothetical protein